MKRILALIFVAASLLFVTASCNKYGYGTYDFVNNYEIVVSDAARATIILGIIQKDDYFFTKHSYKGTLDECVKLAAAEFDQHINALDINTIESQLTLNEYVRINLWSMNPGQRWLSYIIRNDGLLLNEKLF